MDARQCYYSENDYILRKTKKELDQPIISDDPCTNDKRLDNYRFFALNYHIFTTGFDDNSLFESTISDKIRESINSGYLHSTKPLFLSLGELVMPFLTNSPDKAPSDEETVYLFVNFFNNYIQKKIIEKGIKIIENNPQKHPAWYTFNKLVESLCNKEATQINVEYKELCINDERFIELIADNWMLFKSIKVVGNRNVESLYEAGRKNGIARCEEDMSFAKMSTEQIYVICGQYIEKKKVTLLCNPLYLILYRSISILKDFNTY